MSDLLGATVGLVADFFSGLTTLAVEIPWGRSGLDVVWTLQANGVQVAAPQIIEGLLVIAVDDPERTWSVLVPLYGYVS